MSKANTTKLTVHLKRQDGGLFTDKVPLDLHLITDNDDLVVETCDAKKGRAEFEFNADELIKQHAPKSGDGVLSVSIRGSDFRELARRESVSLKGGSTLELTLAAAEAMTQAPTSDVRPVYGGTPEIPKTTDQILWKYIEHVSDQLQYNKVAKHLESLCHNDEIIEQCPALVDDLCGRGTQSYEIIDKTIECYIANLAKGKVDWSQFDDAKGSAYRQYMVEHQDYKVLPYMERVLRRMQDTAIETNPCLTDTEVTIALDAVRYITPCELIWSYWVEESGLMQSINAIALRFQNRALKTADPLANLNLDPLRRLNNLMWGFIQKEGSRLGLARRAYEYDHHYGFSIEGKAVPPLHSADSRSRFLQAFHQLLWTCSRYFLQVDDQRYVADAFPVLHALREVHMLLAEGMHNQYGDLPRTLRKEMLICQWLLARPEMREFLNTRPMVPQPEPWMDRVDVMRKLQGWGDLSTNHFRELAVTGEQLLLSIRFGNWSDTDAVVDANAANWANHWRTKIQRYLHAYRAATGVNLASVPEGGQVDSTPPAKLLKSRIQSRAA